METSRTKKRQTCTDHCSECGGHFHGLEAYDRHLKRVNVRKNRFDAVEYDIKHVVGSEAKLEVWTEEGYCDVAASGPLEGITIWQRELDAKRKAWLASLKTVLPASS